MIPTHPAFNTTRGKLPESYSIGMATKSDRKNQRTALPFVTTMEETPVLTTQERAEVIDSH